MQKWSVFPLFTDKKEVYFSGGYITRHHGSGNTDAIQLETPSDLRRNCHGERSIFAQAMGKAICDFYSFHYSSSETYEGWESVIFLQRNSSQSYSV